MEDEVTRQGDLIHHEDEKEDEVGGEVQRALQAQIANTVRSGLDTARRLHQPAGLMGEPWPTGATALWAAILLGIYLVGTFV